MSPFALSHLSLWEVPPATNQTPVAFLTASSVAIAVLGEAVMLIIIIISKILSRCSFITNLLYYNNIYDVKI